MVVALVITSFLYSIDTSAQVLENTSLSVAPPLRSSTKSRSSSSLGKNEIIARLHQIKARISQEIDSTESASKRRLQETTSIGLRGGADLALAESRVLRLKEELTSLEGRRSELYARRVLLDRLIFATDTKWNGQPLAQFLEHQFLDMAAHELTGPGAAGPTWAFMVYASVVAREIPEPREDALMILESYMRFATVLSPKSPAEFQASRDYSNESDSVRARLGSKETLGEEVEKKLAEIQGENPKKPMSAKSSAKSLVNSGVKRGDLELKIRGLPSARPMTPASTPTSTENVAVSNDQGSSSAMTQEPGDESSSASSPETKPDEVLVAPSPAPTT